LKEQLVTRLAAAVSQLQADGSLPADLSPEIMVERTRDRAHGDFASNLAMTLAKAARCKPRDLAERIVAAMETDARVTRIDIAGPGFINFHLGADAWHGVITDILTQGGNYGRSDLGKGKRVQVEFVSANPTGPLHVGHGRGAAYGAAVADLLQAVGFAVHREYYVNDAGRQMDILATSVWLRYLELGGEEFDFPANGYQGDYVQDIAATLRREHPGVIDQDLPPFVIHDETGSPVGPIVDGDVVVFFNFRGDRAIEISRAFTEDDFSRFDRGRRPRVSYAGMMEYDGDLGIPTRYLVEPPAISRTVSEYLVHNGVAQLATAETQKFGHVTYFWNGNNSEKFDPELEDWIEVPSDVIPFERAPAMKAPEVCSVVVDALRQGRHRFIRVNFANGDMVGHTGVLEAAVEAMEVVDRCLGRLEEVVAEVGGTMIVTADHGNLDMMLEVDKKTGQVKLDRDGEPVVKTSHTLSPVPWLLVGEDADRFEANPRVEQPGLGNLAATILMLLGFELPPDYLPPLIVPRR